MCMHVHVCHCVHVPHVCVHVYMCVCLTTTTAVIDTRLPYSVVALPLV